jgi:hypothetical protein
VSTCPIFAFKKGGVHAAMLIFFSFPSPKHILSLPYFVVTAPYWFGHMHK